MPKFNRKLEIRPEIQADSTKAGPLASRLS